MNINKIKKELKDFKKYILDNKHCIITLFIICFLIYSIRLFFINTSIDSESITNNYYSNKIPWASIGRWSLYISKSFLYLNQFYNPFYVYILTIIFFTSSSILFSYTISKIINKKEKNKIILMLFSSLYLTSPLYVEQFSFTLQSAEVSFAFFLLSICFYLMYRYIYCNEKIWSLFAILFLVYSFGTYQAFFPFFILMAASMFFLINSFNNNISKNKMVEIMEYIAVFLISLILYFIISKIITNHYSVSSSYLSNQVLWKTENFITCIKYIYRYLKMVIFPRKLLFYNYSFLIFSILSLIISIKKIIKDRQITTFLSLIIIIISPFIMCFLTASSMPCRTQFMLPFVNAILSVYIYCSCSKTSYLKTFVLIVSIFTVCFQFKVSSDLLYSDQIRYEEDKRLLTSVMNIINSNYNATNKEIIFIGEYNLKSTGIRKGDILGATFFGWDIDTPLGSNQRIFGFSQTLGIKYNAPTIEHYIEAKKIANEMEIYPSKNSIKEMDQYIIIKLAND